MAFETCKENTLHGKCKQHKDFRMKGTDYEDYCFYHQKIKRGLMRPYDPSLLESENDE